MDKVDYNNNEFVNNLVDKYQETNKCSYKLKLIEAFYPFFNKYSQLLCGHTCSNINNKDTLRFLRLFMTKEERDDPSKTLKAAGKYVYILRSTFMDYSKQDMFDEMLLFFLQSLQRYKPMIADHKKTKERISFTHYIQVNLRYKLKALVTAKMRDALTGDRLIEFNEDILVEQSKLIGEDWNAIDIKWVHGECTNDIFMQLDEIERYILWMKYESDPNGKELSSNSISKITGLHKKTIDYRLKKIREKLKEYSKLY